MALILIVIIVFLAILIWVVMQQPQFGKAPAGARLERILQSPHYSKGAFRNLSHTPDITEGVSYYTVLKEFVFGKSKRVIPASAMPSIKTSLVNLNPRQDILVWFGHSSYFMQVDGKRILVDPVFSGNASPVSFAGKSFKGSDAYTTDDFPEIDYLFISHDHYDHLDYKTIKALQPKVKKVLAGLGVGAHFEHWGYDANKIIESDWNEQIMLDEGFIVNTTSARHFSGRGFKRNGTLWMAYVLRTPNRKIYIGGDSGYGSHFTAIGNEFGPFDLAILEDGQYDKNWKYIHMMPEEVVQAAIDLKAKKLLPVHWSKFALGTHDWDEPIIRVVNESKIRNIPILHPMIGELVNLDEEATSSQWWLALN